MYSKHINKTRKYVNKRLHSKYYKEKLVRKQHLKQGNMKHQAQSQNNFRKYELPLLLRAEFRLGLSFFIQRASIICKVKSELQELRILKLLQEKESVQLELQDNK